MSQGAEYMNDPAAKRCHARISTNAGLLVSGWTERIDYVVEVATHECGRTAPLSTAHCECPTEKEKRSRSVQRPGLLEQLSEFKKHKDTDREPKAERGAPRVKTAGRPPGDLQGFFTLDEITCDVYSTADRILEEAGRDRSYIAGLNVQQALLALPYQCSRFGDERPDLAHQLAKATDNWVGAAKRALRMTVSDAIFGDTLCGNCEVGGLAIAWDNNSDVRCIGTPAQPPCGHVYPMSEWVSLYGQGKK